MRPFSGEAEPVPNLLGDAPGLADLQDGWCGTLRVTETSVIEMNDDGLEIEWTAERLCGPPAQDSGLQCTPRDERGTSDGH
jgi:hypothetical protein